MGRFYLLSLCVSVHLFTLLYSAYLLVLKLCSIRSIFCLFLF
ncbi:zinc finger protein 644, isoform CRA_a [Mus musculus]|nr:zinc finger protein 644, isoform CRA_a [Mus musculus]